MRKYPFLIAIAAASLMIAGCTEELNTEIIEPGTDIVFGASTGWENDIQTRTEYSGKDENNAGISKGSGYERIDWVESMDRFRVLCEAATGKADPTKKTADYVVSGVKVGSEKQKSVAEAVSCDDNALQWGTGEHVFYAMYPAPGMGSTYDFNYKYVTASRAKIEAASGTKAKITGLIPAAQECYKVGQEYKPNMNYAYMYATTTASKGPVSLSFKPLVTAFEVTVKAGDSDAVGMKLKSVEIYSEDGTDGTDMTGDFTATISADGTYTVQKSNTGRRVKVTVAESDQQAIATGSALKFTLLALPVDQTRLTLLLTFDKGGTAVTRRLALRADLNEDGTIGDGEWITVEAGKKIYISNLGVPGDVWTYTLSDVPDIVIEGHAAGSKSANISSYRSSRGSEAEFVPLTYKYSTDGTSFQTGLPAGLESLVQSDGTTATKKKLTASVGAHDDTEPLEKIDEIFDHALVMKGRDFVGSDDNPYDLSLHTVEGNLRNGRNVVTANSYVITHPGTYSFPLVYGNAIDAVKNGKINATEANGGNTAAYKAANASSPFTQYVRFDGNPITRPYILWDISKNTGDAATNYVWNVSEGVPRYELVVLWQDAPVGQEIITKPVTVKQYSDSYGLGHDVIYAVFTVDKTQVEGNSENYTLKGARQGNFVIALRVAAHNGITVAGTNWPKGTILWSWHIWVTDNDVNPVPVKTKGSSVTTSNDMMPMHLGWCDEKIYDITHYKDRIWYVQATQTQHAEGQEPLSTVFRVIQRGDTFIDLVKYSAATTYQWGRKDPLLPGYNKYTGTGDAYGMGDSEQYHPFNKSWSSPSGYSLAGTDEGYIARAALSGIPEMIRKPYLFNEGNIFAYNAWNANASSELGKDVKVVKTVYDPCPPGYSVPHKWAFSNFNTLGTSTPIADTDMTHINAKDLDGDGEITTADFKIEDGWYFYTGYGDNTIFFPGTTGRVDHYSYIRYYHQGYIWTACRDQDEAAGNGGFDFHYRGGAAMAWISGPGHALTVHPVKEL